MPSQRALKTFYFCHSYCFWCCYCSLKVLNLVAVWRFFFIACHSIIFSLRTADPVQLRFTLAVSESKGKMLMWALAASQYQSLWQIFYSLHIFHASLVLALLSFCFKWHVVAKHAMLFLVLRLLRRVWWAQPAKV